MKTNNNFKALFSLSLLTTVIGASLKIMHWEHSYPILVIGILLTFGYIILGITEVNNSNKIEKSEKIMWTVGFIFFGFFTAIVYLLSGRKRIV